MDQDQLEKDVLPDFCTGFLYVTKPSVGAALAQAGLELYKDSADIVITEDGFHDLTAHIPLETDAIESAMNA